MHNAPSSKERTTAEQHKAAARAEFEIRTNEELDWLDVLLAPNLVHHDPCDPHAADRLEGLKESIRLNRTAFPDLKITVEDQVAEGQKVATRWSATMTHAGELMGRSGLTPSGSDHRTRTNG